MFDGEDLFALINAALVALVAGIIVFVGWACRLGGKAAAYEEVCQKACPTQTAQVIEGPAERVCMCGTHLDGTLVLELPKHE